MSQVSFRAASDPKALFDVYYLATKELLGPVTGRVIAEQETKHHLEDKNEYGGPEAFYLEDAETGKVVSGAVVRRFKGFYRASDRPQAISSVPDPDLLGVKTVTFLTIGYVLTAREYRGKGFAQRLLQEVISYTEEKILKEELDRSDPAKKDSLKNMVVIDGEIDPQLARYYLGKKYYWVLYSSVGRYYEKFGFKPYPLNFYKIPISLLSPTKEETILKLVANSQQNLIQTLQDGKTVRFLHADKPDDLNLIQFIFNAKELEIVTDLNKLTFHSELAGNRRSSSSLTDMPTVLRASKSGSFNALSTIVLNNPSSTTQLQQGRNSSIHEIAIPKVAIKPDYKHFIRSVTTDRKNVTAASADKATADYLASISGAILTNPNLQKSYFVLWSTMHQNRLYIVGMGELHTDILGSMLDPLGRGGSRSRRNSSFAGVEGLEGYNFADLDFLISLTCYFGKHYNVDADGIYVSTNDLPTNIPEPVIHDYYLQYLPTTYETVSSPDDATKPPNTKVQFLTNCESKLSFLPMLKKFGTSSTEFDIDWYANGIGSFF